MIDERQQEQAALYVLDLLEGAERLAFEAELAQSAELRQLVAELRDASSHLAFNAPAVSPTAELKARILAQIARTPQPALAPVIRPAVFSLTRLLPWAAAAAIAIGCAWLAGLYQVSSLENRLLRNEQALADLALRSARNQLEAERVLAKHQLGTAEVRAESAQRELDRARELLAGLKDQMLDEQQKFAAAEARHRREADLAQLKIATLASLAGNSPEALAVAVWNPARQEGVFKFARMAKPAEGRDYELWVIDPTLPKPVSAGVFAVGPDGEGRVVFHAESPVSQAARFAVTSELKGGSPPHSGPHGPAVMAGD